MPALTRVATRLCAGEQVRLEDADGDLLTKAGVNGWRPIRDGERVTGAWFEFGGADYHYGVIVDEKGVRLEDVPFARYTERWGEGVWFYSEIPPRR